jgi:multidrug efflux pump subunit AcrA (membrane-fusion protein)
MLNCFNGCLDVCKIALSMRQAMKLSAPPHIDCRLLGIALIALSIFASACERRSNSVSGTIEVDEVHVGPRWPGRVEKIFAQEGDRLRPGQQIVQLDAAELKARRNLAAAQIESAIRDADSQEAQLFFCVTTQNGNRICSSAKLFRRRTRSARAVRRERRRKS